MNRIENFSEKEEKNLNEMKSQENKKGRKICYLTKKQKILRHVFDVKWNNYPPGTKNIAYFHLIINTN